MNQRSTLVFAVRCSVHSIEHSICIRFLFNLYTAFTLVPRNGIWYFYLSLKSLLISIIVRRWRHLRHGINPTNQNEMFAQTIKRCAYIACAARFLYLLQFTKCIPSLWWARIKWCELRNLMEIADCIFNFRFSEENLFCFRTVYVYRGQAVVPTLMGCNLYLFTMGLEWYAWNGSLAGVIFCFHFWQLLDAMLVLANVEYYALHYPAVNGALSEQPNEWNNLFIIIIFRSQSLQI